MRFVFHWWGQPFIVFSLAMASTIKSKRSNHTRRVTSYLIAVGFMFAHALRKVARHAKVKCSVFAVTEDVNIAKAHEAMCRRWITRYEPKRNKVPRRDWSCNDVVVSAVYGRSILNNHHKSSSPFNCLSEKREINPHPLGLC